MFLTAYQYGKFYVEIYDSIEGLDLHHDLFAGLPVTYFELLESTTRDDLSIRYVNISNEEKVPVCFLYFQKLRFAADNIRISGNIFYRLLISLFLRIRPFNILISGNLFAVNFPTIKQNENAISNHDIIKLIFEFEKRNQSDIIMLKDLPDSFSNIQMTANGFQKYDFDLTMSIDIRPEWKSMETYYAQLKKKYLKRAKKIKLAAAEVSRRELNLQEIDQQMADIDRLFQNVVNNQQIRIGRVKPEYFYEYKKRFPVQFTFIAYYLNEKMVAFATYVDHCEILEVHYIGIDYEHNVSKSLYFNMLFDSLEMAIQGKKLQLELGRTAREAKAMLGAEAIRFNDYILYKTKLASKLSSYLASQFISQIGDDWKKRSPFRSG
jgi:hypothetical protein